MAAKDRTWPSQTVQSFPLPLWNRIQGEGYRVTERDNASADTPAHCSRAHG
jgi:hypothetical protein